MRAYKSWLFVLLWMALSFSTRAQTDEILVVDKYYVVAKSGLSLRALPNTQSERITVIPWATQVKIAKGTEAGFSNWRKVEYEGKLDLHQRITCLRSKCQVRK